MARWTGACLVVIALGACDPNETAGSATSSRPQQTPACVEAGSIKVDGIEIPKSCPTSAPLTPGFSEKLYIGSVLAKLPCRELPDFAGSYWRVVPPHPKHLRTLGHEVIPGKMTLVSDEEARFKAKAIHMHMGSDQPMRFPAKGKLHLKFERIEGPVAVGGCD